ncbi:MAG: cell envelope integrity protein TolA [Burkholderiales bacterium]|nr:cell envelope integrity protein TolA [Burkholderiales bacterium]
MPVAADRLEFAPPAPPGLLRAMVLAIIAHLLLMLALTWGVAWKREAENVTAEAELWSSVPQQAAPKLVEAPPPKPEPEPPKPVVKVTPPKPEPAPLPRQADIALEQEKKKQAELKAKQLALEKHKLEEQKKLELAKKKAAEDKQKQELAARSKQQDDAKRLDAQRQENLKRMQGLAGASGAPTSTGAAQRSSGPSESYAGRIRARVKPNIVFTEDIAGNPMADIEVRTSPDGTIVGQRVLKSSGVRAWDDAVLKAIIKTEVLPRDVDGRVHSPLIISFRPKDL